MAHALVTQILEAPHIVMSAVPLSRGGENGSAVVVDDGGNLPLEPRYASRAGVLGIISAGFIHDPSTGQTSHSAVLVRGGAYVATVDHCIEALLGRSRAFIDSSGEPFLPLRTQRLC